MSPIYIHLCWRYDNRHCGIRRRISKVDWLAGYGRLTTFRQGFSTDELVEGVRCDVAGADDGGDCHCFLHSECGICYDSCEYHRR